MIIILCIHFECFFLVVRDIIFSSVDCTSSITVFVLQVWFLLQHMTNLYCNPSLYYNLGLVYGWPRFVISNYLENKNLDLEWTK